MNQTKLKITKLDAAKRQLEVCILLYFNKRDVVSIHTLAAAAHEILHDLYKNAGKQGLMLKNEIPEIYIKQDSIKDYYEKLRAAENFFKHADRDPEYIFSFNPEPTEIFIWESCIMYSELSKESCNLFQIFHAWYSLNHISIFKREVLELLKTARTELSPLIDKGREYFFQEALKMSLTHLF